MIYAQKITLHRRPGKVRDPAIRDESASLNFLEFEDIWRAADQKLTEWAMQMDVNAWRPIPVDVTVVFRDGQVFHHEYQLFEPRLERPRLAKALTDVIALLSGAGRARFKPRWLHAQVLGINVAKMRWYDEFASTHAFGPPRSVADDDADERRRIA